jgi:hypothetical protein
VVDEAPSADASADQPVATPDPSNDEE